METEQRSKVSDATSGRHHEVWSTSESEVEVLEEANGEGEQLSQATTMQLCSPKEEDTEDDAAALAIVPVNVGRGGGGGGAAASLLRPWSKEEKNRRASRAYYRTKTIYKKQGFTPNKILEKAKEAHARASQRYDEGLADEFPLLGRNID